MGTYLLFFLCGLIFDTLWVLCVHYVSEKRVHLAAITGVMLTALTGLTQAEVAHNRWLLAPELAGIFVGTYVGFNVAERIERMEKNRRDRNP